MQPQPLLDASLAGVSETARRLRGLGPLDGLAVLVILASSAAGSAVSAVLVLVWARSSQTPLRDLGLEAPRSWALTLLAGVVGGVALKLALKAVVMPLLGAPATNTAYHYLVGNAGALPWVIAMVLLNASLGEELFFRGYLVFGAVYAWRKQLWLPIALHAAYDLAAVAIIYWDQEEAVARLVFH